MQGTQATAQACRASRPRWRPRGLHLHGSGEPVGVALRHDFVHYLRRFGQRVVAGRQLYLHRLVPLDLGHAQAAAPALACRSSRQPERARGARACCGRALRRATAGGSTAVCAERPLPRPLPVVPAAMRLRPCSVSSPSAPYIWLKSKSAMASGSRSFWMRNSFACVPVRSTLQPLAVESGCSAVRGAPGCVSTRRAPAGAGARSLGA